MNEKPRILIVDDDESTRQSLSLILNKQGYATETVGTGEEALEKAQERFFNLALADIKLPDMQGVELLAPLKEMHPDMVVIMATAYASLNTAVRALSEGASGYITKPLNMDEVLATVREALEKQRLVGDKRRAEEEIRRLKEFNEGIVQNMAEGIVVQDTEGYFTFVNPAAAAMLGYTPEELLGRHWTDVIPPDQHPIIQAADERRARGEADRYEVDLVHKDGTRLSVLISGSPRYENGHFAGTLAVFTDITARVQHEREREAIATVASALRTAQSRAEMLPVILEQTVALSDADSASLVMCDPLSDETAVELARGEWAQATGMRLPSREGVSGHVIATGQPYVSNDLQNDPHLARLGLTGDHRASAAVPLIAQGQIIGVLMVGSGSAITDGQVRLLIAIGDMVANAIHRATLHEQTERHLKQAQALRTVDQAITASVDLRVTLDVLLDQATTQLEVDAADILLLRRHAHRLEYVAGRGFRSGVISRLRPRLGEGYAGRAALERRTIAICDLRSSISDLESGGAEDRNSKIENLEGFVAYFGVPLIAKGQVQGVLELFHRAPLQPDPEWFEFLESLTAAAAIAIDNAALFDGLQRSNVELTMAYDITLEGWAQALEMRDVATAGHTRRVTEATLRLARALGMSKAELVHVRRGALLHDIGKMGIPDSILHKPGPLDDDEWDIMRQHPVVAYELLSSIAYLRPALDIPYCHHEKWDGSGYPRGLKGEQIPLAARVFAMVDVWDALNSERPYRPAWPEEKVHAYICEQAGKHFDPQMVEVFMGLLEDGAFDFGLR